MSLNHIDFTSPIVLSHTSSINSLSCLLLYPRRSVADAGPIIIKTAGNTAITMIPDNTPEEMKSGFMAKHLTRQKL